MKLQDDNDLQKYLEGEKMKEFQDQIEINKVIPAVMLEELNEIDNVARGLFQRISGFQKGYEHWLNGLAEMLDNVHLEVEKRKAENITTIPKETMAEEVQPVDSGFSATVPPLEEKQSNEWVNKAKKILGK